MVNRKLLMDLFGNLSKFSYISFIKKMKTRQIKNFNQDLKVNRDLFELALEFAN